MRSFVRRTVLYSIRFYQRYLSFGGRVAKYLFLTEGACRYTPSCSQFTYEAVSRYGIIVGLRLGFKRVLRCHPWSSGGYDPVP